MSDAQATHSKPPSDTRRNGIGSRHMSETDNVSSSSTPSAARSKSDSSTPARSSSTLSARQTNSTPRPRLRPAPIRSLSTPLGRSLSMRVSKKEKRWSMRLEDPKSPVPSTYQDDYQSPEALSLRSLNLETTAEHGSDLDLKSQTTYRESFKWPREKFLSSPTSTEKGGLRSKSDDNDTPKRSGNRSAAECDRSADRLTNSKIPVTPKGTGSRNGPVLNQNYQTREESTGSRPEIQSSSTRSSSFFKRNNSSGVTLSRGPSFGQNLRAGNRKSSGSSNVDGVPLNSTNENATSTTKSANGSRPSVNEQGLPTLRTQSQTPLANGVRESNVSSSKSEERPHHRTRAYQLRSSTGGSPFAYGSDSETWV